MAKLTSLDEYLKIDIKNNHFRYMSDDVKNEIIQRTPSCNSASLDERVYWIKNNICEYPKCERCGKVLTSTNWYPSVSKINKQNGRAPKGYRPFCGKTCAMNSVAKHERTIETTLKKYNVRHASQSDEIQHKRKLTNLKKYGESNPMAWSSERFKNAIQELYGVDVVRYIPGVSEKIKETKSIQSLELLKNRIIEVQLAYNVTLISEIPLAVTSIFDIEFQWKHSCGHEFNSNITQRGLRHCPKCSYGTSNAERSIGDWLEEIGETVIRRDKRFGIEVDLYLPDRKIAIEYDGTYWHSARFVSKNKSIKKLEILEEQGIQLITIQEHLWLLAENKVKHRLISLLKKNISIGARKCSIKQISIVEANTFLINSHLQSGSKSTIAYGLFYKSKLISVMTFGNPRFSKTAKWELIRYACSPGISVQGGGSKLLNAFRTSFKGSIISYADRCWSQGALYKQMNFKFIRNSSPSYFWVSGENIFTRYQTQKNKLPKLLANINREFEPAFSETDNMLAAKFLKVYDRGNSVWLLE